MKDQAPEQGEALDLGPIKAREAPATAGPWQPFDAEGALLSHCYAHVTGDPDSFWRGNTKADGIFIAHARQDIPALVAEVERLRGLLAAREAELGGVVAFLDEKAPLDIDETKPLLQRVRDEWADFMTVVDHLSETYRHFSRGRISKPMTLPREVFSIAEDFVQEDIAEAIREAQQEWQSEQPVTPPSALRALVEKWRYDAGECSTVYREAGAMLKCADELEAVLSASAVSPRGLVIDRDADLLVEMRNWLDTQTITGENIGNIRRQLFMPWDSLWNGWVRDETATRERPPLPLPPAQEKP